MRSKLLAGQGIREVTLLGQNVNSYGQTQDGNPDFTDLIRAIGEIAGIERIRFTTSHPKDLSPKLIALLRESGLSVRTYPSPGAVGIGSGAQKR